MRKRKVLVLTSTFPRWKNDATPPFVYELSKRLAKYFEIYVLAPHFPGAKLYEETDNLKIYRFRYFWPERWEKFCYRGGIIPNLRENRLLMLQIPFLFLSAILAIHRIVENEKINLIHAHWVIPGGLITTCYRHIFHQKIKVLITDHSSNYKFFLGVVPANILYKWVVRHCHQITAVSHDLQSIIYRYTKIKPQVISMGVDHELFKVGKPDKKIISRYGGDILLFVGRLIEEKGLDFLIKVMKEIISERPSAVLLIIGEGPLKTRLQQTIKEFNLDKNIYLLGPMPHEQLVNYYQSAKIYVGPSKKESFGLVFIEAMMSGCLVVSSNLKSIADIVVNNKTGLQLAINDYRKFGEKLVKLLNNYKEYRTLRKVGRLYAIEHYSWDTVANKYVQVYEEFFKKAPL